MDNIKEYRDMLDNWHAEMTSVAQVCSHLLDQMVDDRDVPEWRRAAAWLMRDKVVQVAQACPLPDLQRGTAAQKEGSGDCCA
jgi:uncharacterized protein (UPF0147 family)